MTHRNDHRPASSAFDGAASDTVRPDVTSPEAASAVAGVM